jgi:DNA repair protein RadC
MNTYLKSRLDYFGPESLTLRELLMMILGEDPNSDAFEKLWQLWTSGAQTDFEQSQSLFNAFESHRDPFSGVEVIDEVARARVRASFELARRYWIHVHARVRKTHEAREDFLGRDTIRRQAVHRIPEQLRAERREWIGFVPLFGNCRMGDFYLVGRGLSTHVYLDAPELFRRLLAVQPQGFFLFHNHPSGELLPSHEDIELSRHVDRLSAEFKIKLLGHAIVTSADEDWINYRPVLETELDARPSLTKNSRIVRKRRKAPSYDFASALPKL